MLQKSIWRNKLIQFFSFLLICAAFFYAFPIHQDEFINYLSLRYLDGDFQQVAFRNGYLAYVKRLPFSHIELTQPYMYVGNLQSALFYPFYILFDLLHAKFVYGFFSLTITVILMKKVFKSDSYWPFILFPPLLITVLHDGGPVNLMINLILLIKIFTEKLVQEKNRYRIARYCILIMSCLIICLFDKIFILYLVPGIFFFAIAEIDINKNNLTRIYGWIILLILFTVYAYAFINTGVLARDFNADTLSFANKKYTENLSNPAEWNTILIDRLISLRAVVQGFDYTFYINRNFDVDPYFKFMGIGPLMFTIIVIAILAIMIYGIIMFRRMLLDSSFKVSFSVQRPIILYTLSLLCFIIPFLMLGRVRYGHHTLYLFLPVFGIIFKLMKNKNYRKFIYLTHIILCCVLFFNIFQAKKQYYNELSFVEVHELIERNAVASSYAHSAVNFSGWSYYYMEDLYKRKEKRLITNVDLEDIPQVDRLTQICAKNKWPLINIFTSSKYSKSTLEEQKAVLLKYFTKCTVLASTEHFLVCKYE